jgi:hypothetical protein
MTIFHNPQRVLWVRNFLRARARDLYYSEETSLAADRDETGLKIPILSDILERDVPRRSFLVGLFEPAADWLAFTLTQASAVLLQGNLVVNFVSASTPPSKVREILQRFTPNLWLVHDDQEFMRRRLRVDDGTQDTAPEVRSRRMPSVTSCTRNGLDSSKRPTMAATRNEAKT